MAKIRMKQIWATPKFHKFVYEKKAENPDRTITQILDDLADNDKKEKKKRNVFPNF